MNQRLYSDYGERFIREFLKNKGNEIFLNIVFEDGIPNGLAFLPGLNCLEIKDSNHPRFKSFFGKLYEANGWKILQQKLPNGKIETKLFHDFRFDANRFSFKIFSLILSKKKDKSTLPFAWIDADVRCLKKFSSLLIIFEPQKIFTRKLKIFPFSELKITDLRHTPPAPQPGLHDYILEKPLTKTRFFKSIVYRIF